MVTARIRTNARRITVRVRSAPVRTIVARPGRSAVVVPAGTPTAPSVIRQKPALRERLLKPFRSAKAR